MRRNFSLKKVAIVGFGVEGAAAAEFLLSRGAEVSVFEQKEESNLEVRYRERAEYLRQKGVQFFFGAVPAAEATAFDLIVRSPGVPLSHPFMRVAQAKEVPVTSGTGLFFEECRAPIIGVTGTKGKGTTASLIYTMLHAAGRPAHLVGNIGEPALGVLKDIAANELVVYELSSFQLIDAVKSPYLAVVLMVTQDHLDFHSTVSEYEKAKANIVRYQGPNDTVVANVDYEASRRIGEASLGKKFWISRHRAVTEGCFVEDGNIVLVRDSVREVIAAASEVALPGPHNLENVCAAVMVAVLVGVPVETIQEVLRTFHGLRHRLRLAGEINNVRYYDDSFSTTPESAIAAIEAFAAPKVLILGGSFKGADFSELGRTIANSSSVRAIIGIGEEWPRIREQVQKNTAQKISFIEGCTTMTEIIGAAEEAAQPGDVVLLSPGCASFGMFASYYDRGDQFIKAVNEL
jgi:UDP-N-acetylmuramoylalanine--D-glutamate ligase